MRECLQFLRPYSSHATPENTAEALLNRFVNWEQKGVPRSAGTAGSSAFDLGTKVTLSKNTCRTNGETGIYFGKGATGSVEDNISEENLLPESWIKFVLSVSTDLLQFTNCLRPV